MIGAEVESVKVEPFRFSLGTLGNFPTHGGKHVTDVINESSDRVRGASRRRNDRQRNVGGLRCEPGVKLSLSKFLLAGLESLIDPAPSLPNALTGILSGAGGSAPISRLAKASGDRSPV